MLYAYGREILSTENVHEKPILIREMHDQQESVYVVWNFLDNIYDSYYQALV